MERLGNSKTLVKENQSIIRKSVLLEAYNRGQIYLVKPLEFYVPY